MLIVCVIIPWVAAEWWYYLQKVKKHGVFVIDQEQDLSRMAMDPAEMKGYLERKGLRDSRPNDASIDYKTKREQFYLEVVSLCKENPELIKQLALGWRAKIVRYQKSTVTGSNPNEFTIQYLGTGGE